MSFDVPQAFRALDEVWMRYFFQRLVNWSGISNYLWAQFFCFLGAGSSVSMLIWWMLAAIFPLEKIALFSFLTLLYLWGMRKFLQLETRRRPHMMKSFMHGLILIRVLRVILVLIMAIGLDILFAKRGYHWRLDDLMFFFSTLLSVPFALYFAGCDPPPAKPKKTDTLQRISVLH